MKSVPNLEALIEGLDQRGLLVLQVLLGQKAMEVLALEKINAVSLSSGLNATSLIKPISTLKENNGYL